MVDGRMESLGLAGDMDLDELTPEQLRKLFGADVEFIGAALAASA